MMRFKKVEDVIQASETLAQENIRLIEFLNSVVSNQDQSFDLENLITGKDSSTAQVSARIFSVTEIIGKFNKNTNAELVPLDTINQLENAVVNSTQKITTLISYMESQSQNKGGFNTFNYDNFHASMMNGQLVNCQPQFAAYADVVETLLKAFYSNLVILKPTKASYSFQAAANALSDMLARTEESHDLLRGKLSDLDEVSSVVDRLKHQAEDSANEASRLEKQSATERQSIGEYLADVTEKNTTVANVHTDAISLAQAIQDYQKDFASFQGQLDKRNSEFENGSGTLDGLIKNFKSQHSSVADLVSQSEDMLKSATVAGLAAHFDTIRNSLTGELRWARVSFYFAIVFLLICSLPLALMILWPILAPLIELYNPALASSLKAYSPSANPTGWQYLGQVVARLVILVPAAWLVSFSAIRHSSLFRLREHYTYKYSMAVSVEGFKKQAKGYEDEIAALVLEQLAFNPADKLIASKNIPEGKAPLTSLMKFFKRRIDIHLEKLDEPEK